MVKGINLELTDEMIRNLGINEDSTLECYYDDGALRVRIVDDESLQNLLNFDCAHCDCCECDEEDCEWDEEDCDCDDDADSHEGEYSARDCLKAYGAGYKDGLIDAIDTGRYLVKIVLADNIASTLERQLDAVLKELRD